LLTYIIVLLCKIVISLFKMLTTILRLEKKSVRKNDTNVKQMADK